MADKESKGSVEEKVSRGIVLKKIKDVFDIHVTNIIHHPPNGILSDDWIDILKKYGPNILDNLLRDEIEKFKNRDRTGV